MKSSLVAPAIPEPVWAPALTVLAVGLLALGGWALGRPLLLPSLGPTIFMIALQPADPTIRFYNIVIGHAIGLGSGFLVVRLLPAEPVVIGMAALVVTLLAQKLARATHIPAAATTLLISLGFVPATGETVLRFAVGVLIVGAVAEGARRLRTGPSL